MKFDSGELLWSQLDAMAESVRNDGAFALTAGHAQAVAGALVAGYAAWTLRAGYAAAWLGSSIPAWLRFDPLPILNSASALLVSKDEDQETLADIAHVDRR